MKELLTPTAQIALVMAIAELFKGIGFPKKYIPLVDVLFGLLSGIFVYKIEFGYSVVNSIMIGLAIGLSACGLFSGIKNIIERKDETNERN